MRKFHPDKVADEKLECQLCHAKFKRRDNLTFYTRACEFHASGKRPSEGQISGGSKPKTKGMDIWESKSQALDHTTDKFIINLEQLDQMQETSIEIFKKFIMDFKPTIEEELETCIEGRHCLACCFSSSHRPYFPDRTASSLQKLTSQNSTCQRYRPSATYNYRVNPNESGRMEWMGFTPTIATQHKHIHLRPASSIGVHPITWGFKSKACCSQYTK